MSVFIIRRLMQSAMVIVAMSVIVFCGVNVIGNPVDILINPEFDQEELERDADNTTLARFIRNLESRIYAQLSRQLVDNLFGETANTSGTLELEGNTIEYSTDGDYITLIITDQDGNTTEITLPIGDFSF